MIDRAARQRFRFVVATSSSTICRMLDVELVRDLNVGQAESWGAVFTES